MKTLDDLRQMMADGKFIEAEKFSEAVLKNAEKSSRKDLLEIYLTAKELQRKLLPAEPVLEFCEHLAEAHDFEASERWFIKIPPDQKEKYFLRSTLLTARHAEWRGNTKEVYETISRFQVWSFENKIPILHPTLRELSQKYFQNDFSLELQRLSLELLLQDHEEVKKSLDRMILHCFERSTTKDLRKKLTSINDLLSIGPEKGVLEIYQNLCRIYGSGVVDPQDYKKLIEMVLYFDDFRFQAMVLQLLVNVGLTEEAKLFSEVLRSNPQYDFVYLDKYYRDLKKFFILKKKPSPGPEARREVPDLTLEQNAGARSESPDESEVPEEHGEDEVLGRVLGHLGHETNQLLELAVSFIQSSLPLAAIKACNLVIDGAADREARLKAMYLKFSCLMHLKNYREAIDLTFTALELAESRDDLLAFMYGQAEAYLRIGQKASAKSILSRIVTVDANYRFARERLEKLNEV